MGKGVKLVEIGVPTQQATIPQNLPDWQTTDTVPNSDIVALIIISSRKTISATVITADTQYRILLPIVTTSTMMYRLTTIFKLSTVVWTLHDSRR